MMNKASVLLALNMIGCFQYQLVRPVNGDPEAYAIYCDWDVSKCYGATITIAKTICPASYNIYYAHVGTGLRIRCVAHK